MTCVRVFHILTNIDMMVAYLSPPHMNQQMSQAERFQADVVVPPRMDFMIAVSPQGDPITLYRVGDVMKLSKKPDVKELGPPPDHLKPILLELLKQEYPNRKIDPEIIERERQLIEAAHACEQESSENRIKALKDLRNFYIELHDHVVTKPKSKDGTDRFLRKIDRLDREMSDILARIVDPQSEPMWKIMHSLESRDIRMQARDELSSLYRKYSDKDIKAWTRHISNVRTEMQRWTQAEYPHLAAYEDAVSSLETAQKGPFDNQFNDRVHFAQEGVRQARYPMEEEKRIDDLRCELRSKMARLNAQYMQQV